MAPKHSSAATALTYLIVLAGEPTGPVISSPPPEPSSETAQLLKEASQSDSLGQQQSGKDQVGNEQDQTEFGAGGKPMTAGERDEVGGDPGGGDGQPHSQ